MAPIRPTHSVGWDVLWRGRSFGTDRVELQADRVEDGRSGWRTLLAPQGIGEGDEGQSRRGEGTAFRTAAPCLLRWLPRSSAPQAHTECLERPGAAGNVIRGDGRSRADLLGPRRGSEPLLG